MSSLTTYWFRPIINVELAVVICTLAVIILMIDEQSTYAQTGALISKHPQADYQRGFKHGVQDAQPTTKIVYIWSPGHGFINQTKSFIDGYVNGFCSVAGSDASMDEDEATFWCSEGQSSASWAIG